MRIPGVATHKELRVILIAAVIIGAPVAFLVAAQWLAHRPPEGGRNLLTVESPVSVERFEVTDARGNVLWRISSTPARPVSTIHYGELPVGFTQLIPESGRPRPFNMEEPLHTFTLTTDWQFSHSGVAIGPDKFLGGSYLNGPREPPAAQKTGV